MGNIIGLKLAVTYEVGPVLACLNIISAHFASLHMYRFYFAVRVWKKYQLWVFECLSTFPPHNYPLHTKMWTFYVWLNIKKKQLKYF